LIRALALRLRGPLQSWGGPTAGDDRPTLDIPTQTGVLGLVAGALGLRRADTEALARLHAEHGVSVRVDASGVQGVDYHTSLDVPGRGGGRQSTKTVVSRRSYLYDACFTAVVAPRIGTPERSAEQMAEALQRPCFAPYLGRRSCPPSERILLDVAEGASPLEILLALPEVDGLGGRRERDWHFFVDGKPGDGIEGYIRTLRVRDMLLAGGPRLMGERWVSHIRRPRPPALSTRTAPDWFLDAL
jgi:CRISPR system Cascade subunit CasD